jgi:hypothetical protein
MAKQQADSEERASPRRRKRRRRRTPAASEAEPRQPLDTNERERPAFLLSFPHHPELDRLIAAFEAGNYALIRNEAPRLAEQTRDPAIRDAALELRRRIEPDPLVKYLLAISVALLVFLVLYAYVLHDHP